MDILEPRFQEASYPVHSYPELSLEAWLYKDPTTTVVDEDEHEETKMMVADEALTEKCRTCAHRAVLGG